MFAGRSKKLRLFKQAPTIEKTASEEALEYFPLDEDQILIKTDRESKDKDLRVRVHLPNCSCGPSAKYSCEPDSMVDSKSKAETEALIVLGMLGSAKFGATLPVSHFSGSPQQHAIMNRQLLDFFAGQNRARETTPYNIPNSQKHLLSPLGMELPNLDAPEAPHALHKSIEEFQLRRLRRFLPDNNYGIISVKSSKLALLPPAASVQNPVYEAKDASRYPGAAVKHSNFTDHNLYFMHDVASEVYPHELVEKLVSENPEAQLLVTGMHPAEVLDGAATWEPASHRIEYDGANYNYIFVDSETESYSTPVHITTTWLRTSSICASNGVVYHVTLLENKLGHCLYHIFCGDATEQHTRTFSTGSMVQLPPSITGTLRGEYLPANLISGILDFDFRAVDLSRTNLASKVTQLANAINPRTTSRERWIACHIAYNVHFRWTLGGFLRKAFWNTLYALSFQWQMFKSLPEIYTFVEERKRTRTIHPTPGGGWSPRVKDTFVRKSIPNSPTLLHRLSALTSTIFVFMIPKLLIGEVLSNVFMHVPLTTIVKDLVKWTDLKPLRLVLTASIAVVTAVLPGHIVKIFSRLAGHFYRQLWWPGWVNSLFERVITEICGGPGYSLLPSLPGRGWLWQLNIWWIAACSILPGLISHSILPWVAFAHPVSGVLLGLFYALIVLENYCGCAMNVPCTPPPIAGLSFANMWEWPELVEYGFKISVNWIFTQIALGFQRNTGNCQRLANLPPLPTTAPVVVRRRNVNVPLPNVIVMPTNAANAPAGAALAVDPAGMNFNDWMSEVQRNYAITPTAYPNLTPGRHCFWDCVSSFGGTPHMWYSWHMAFTQSRADPNNPIVGEVTMAQMQTFCANSQFGMNLVGMVPTTVASQGANWPVMQLRISRSVIAGLLHIEIAGLQPPVDAVSSLAKLLRTIRTVHPAWFTAEVNRYNAVTPQHIPRSTAICNTFMGTLPMVTTMMEISDAIIANASASQIVFNDQQGYNLDPQMQFVAPFPPLFQYSPPMATQTFAFTHPSVMWQRFRSAGNGVSAHLRKLNVRNWFPHPSSEPHMKIGAMPSQISDNRSRNNLRPDPSRWTTLRNELASQVEEYRNLLLPDVPLQEELLLYTADVQRASRLAADLKAHPSVLESKSDITVIQSLDSVIDTWKTEHRTVQIPVRAYFGVAGCGKTTATIAFLHTLSPEERSQVRIVSHTESLRAQAKVSVDFPEMRGFNFPTISSIITEPSSGIIVLDDAGKYWGGVLDLIILANPMVTQIVINGDPPQGISKIPIQGSQSGHDLSAVQCIAPLATRYATRSYRQFGIMADTLGIRTTNSERGHVTHTVGPKVGIPVCTASPRYVGVLTGAGREAYTYESVQGEEFKQEVEIDMTGLEGAISDRTAYVSLTRSSKGVYLHTDAANPNSVIKAPPSGSDIMNALIYSMRASNGPTLANPDWLVKACFYRHLHWCMPLLPWFAKIGATVDASTVQMIAPMSNSVNVVDASPNEIEVSEPVVQSTAASENLPHETHFIAKEFRELNTVRGQTDQFKETAFVNPHVHKRGDTPTYFESVDKRLKRRTYEQNQERMEKCPRQELIDEYDKLIPNPVRMTPENFEGYVDRAIDEYASKRTLKDVEAKFFSHDPDRTGSDIKISLKNQVIKKAEKRNKTEAIPGQLIHEYDILTTITDSAYALWFEDHVITGFPEQFSFYMRLDPASFKAKYKSRWRVNNGIHTSDVTRWDVGCDAGLLNLDLHIMNKAGFPALYVEEYKHRRLSSRSQHGPMATMQNSGDRYTWAINSVRRAVVASWVLQILPEDTCMINGDDEATDRICASRYLADTPWVFKDQNGMRGEFSGFELGGEEPVYSAEGIYYRALILESRDPSAQDKWTNYLELVALADPDSTEAMSVVLMAQRYMLPHLFVQFLPEQFRSHFPNLDFV